MKKVYLRYQKQINGFIDVNKFMLIFDFVLLFVVKGGIDCFNKRPYDWVNYLTQVIRYSLGTFGFFGIILVIECVRSRSK